MRNLFLVLLLTLLVAFAGCGGGDDKSSTSTDTSVGNDTFIEYTPAVFKASSNAYNFNDDGTALLSIEQLILNQWEVPFPQDAFNAADKEGKRKFYEAYIASAITQSESLLPIYAPQGDAGDFSVDVNNGVIDFTNYKLPADIDGDGQVTLDEDATLLIDALVDNVQGSVYDVNSDNVVDNRDLLYLVARLLTQVDSFHFYTTDGKELGVKAKLWDDSHVVDLSALSDTPQQVRIIVRDINGASSVKDEPSITQDEWHSGSTLVKSPKLSRDTNTSCSIESSILENLFPPAESKYVIGFQGSVKHVMGETVNGEAISQSDISNCFNQIVLEYFNSDIHKYFVPYNMNESANWAMGGVTVVVRDGFNYDVDLLRNISAFNAYSKDIPAEVHARNVSIKNSYTKGDKIIYTYSMVHIEAVYQESDAKYPLKGKITREATDPYDDCGSVTLNRVGPGPASHTDSKTSTELEGMDASYEFEDNLAMGHHSAILTWEEGSTYELDENYMFIKDEKSYDFAIPMKYTAIKGKVLDANDEPVEGVNLSLISTCPGGPPRQFSTSKDDGSYEFGEVYIGEYNIQIENETKAVVAQVGRDVDKDIKTESLWKFHVSVSNPYGSGTMSVKKFPINTKRFKMENGYAPGSWIASVYDSSEAEISFTGSLYYHGDLFPLEINYEPLDMNNADVKDYYLHFNAMQDIPGVPTSENMWVMSGSEVKTFTTTADGRIKDDFEAKVLSETKMEWRATGEDTVYIFTLEPCKNSECSDEENTENYDDFDDEFNN